ncbi:MAG: hypothetical protein JSW49_04090 [candidate division WOR-3 bacterium]|nr:MAG: hypothetical protein JSW49_04090 [candidate division WOR-3 bacterium]
MKEGRKYLVFFTLLLLTVYCASNIFAARYYRLLDGERVKYLGLRGIDTLVAQEYLNLDSPAERTEFYASYWTDRDEERLLFEERSNYAFRQFGRSAPLSDDRIPVYVKYGEPRREIITPEKKIGVSASLVVNPAEIWTYHSEGLMFDFVRIARSYELMSVSEFGEGVLIPHLKEIISDTAIEIMPGEGLDFTLAYGRFRQQKNLTRLEIFLGVEIDDTTDFRLYREVSVFNRRDSLVCHTKHILAPEHGQIGMFVDESNLWLKPAEYRVEVTLFDMKRNRAGKQEFSVNLIEYQDDVKEISDLIPVRLIDRAFTHEKFEKPVGRVIPLLQTALPVHKPFYLYSEAYNLQTKDGMYRVRTTYEVFNKEKMRQEVVDVMIKDWIEPGNTAYLGAEYHPMDLVPGSYMIVLKVKDLLSGKERSAVAEFRLVRAD